MTIIICTENQAKIQAVKEVFNKVYSDIQVFGEKFQSEVSEQPLSEEEGIRGALNRAKNAKKKHPKADYYIGMEGYVNTNKFGMFLAGAVVIINDIGITGIGLSAKMELPKFIQKKLIKGQELGPLIATLLNDKTGKVRQASGTNGILSKGLYTRVNEFKDATKCALAKFQSPELFNKK